MSSPTRNPISSEWFLGVLIPLVMAMVAGAGMIRVVSEFGFTALGEPAVITSHGR